jgi:chemotaxis protein MotB
MRERMEAKLSTSEQLRRLMRQVRLINTTEGIRIDLVDDADFSMFQLGTTVLTPQAAKLLDALAEAVAPEAGGFSIRGHTDALPWRNRGVGNNWSLSAGRAEATRQALIREGIDQQRFRKIEGVAEREPLIAGDPADPRNRRISILMTR